MTQDVSRRSLLALGAGLGASALLGGSALAKAPKLGTQAPYFHRFVLGAAEVTVVSDGVLPLGDPVLRLDRLEIVEQPPGIRRGIA